MILIFIVLACLIVYYYWERRKLIYFASKMKGLNGYPIIGSAHKFLNPNRERKYSVSIRVDPS